MIVDSRFFRCALVAAWAVVPLAAQSVSIYLSSNDDGTYLTATGILQYSANNCSWCSTAQHTYQQTVTITSPSGRTGSCSFYTSAGLRPGPPMRCPSSG